MKKYFVSMEKVRTFAHAFDGESTAKQQKKPHSSSGPGHLPLTQKIISSTLICGTKTKTPLIRWGLIVQCDMKKMSCFGVGAGMSFRFAPCR